MEASAIHAPAALSRFPLGGALLRLRSDEQLRRAVPRPATTRPSAILHDRYRQRLFAYVRQMLSAGSRQDAEDVLQDVFVRAYGALRNDNREMNVRAWLYRVAHNRCIDHLRRPVPPAGRDLRGLAQAAARPGRGGPAPRRPAPARRRRRPAARAAALGAADARDRRHDLRRPRRRARRHGPRRQVAARPRPRRASSRPPRRATPTAPRSSADLLRAYDRGVKASGRARKHMRSCDGCTRVPRRAARHAALVRRARAGRRRAAGVRGQADRPRRLGRRRGAAAGGGGGGCRGGRRRRGDGDGLQGRRGRLHGGDRDRRRGRGQPQDRRPRTRPRPSAATKTVKRTAAPAHAGADRRAEPRGAPQVATHAPARTASAPASATKRKHAAATDAKPAKDTKVAAAPRSPLRAPPTPSDAAPRPPTRRSRPAASARPTRRPRRPRSPTASPAPVAPVADARSRRRAPATAAEQPGRAGHAAAAPKPRAGRRAAARGGDAAPPPARRRPPRRPRGRVAGGARLAAIDYPSPSHTRSLLVRRGRRSGLFTMVAVHSTARGPALGGCRMWTYDDARAAVRDVLRLSRAMTFKAAVAGLPLGGGKGVIMLRPDEPTLTPERREAVLQDFGDTVEALGGDYLTAEDVGTSRARHGGDRRAAPSTSPGSRRGLAAIRARGPRSAARSPSARRCERVFGTDDLSGRRDRRDRPRQRRRPAGRDAARGRRASSSSPTSTSPSASWPSAWAPSGPTRCRR